MTVIKIDRVWDKSALPAFDELEATLCKLSIHVSKKNVTEYRTPEGKSLQALHIPAYYLAEWMAENWWALLYEPRKNEDEGDDRDFLSRHTLIDARHGFILPDLTIVSVGRAVRITVERYRSQFGGGEFRTFAVADGSHDEVSSALGSFVSDCVEQLRKRGIEETPLEDAWTTVKATQPNEVEFCELVGSLGLCPYTVDSDTADAVDQLVDILGSRAARDFCLAAKPEQLLQASGPLAGINEGMRNAPNLTLAPLLQVSQPSDNLAAPSWRRGLNAAKCVLADFHIAASDPRGADKFFERLHIDTDAILMNAPNSLPLIGAVERSDTEAKMALLQADESRRRFAAARASYLAWVSEPHSSRLVTAALTRDQQASRQFAAEILVPRAYLESQARGRKLQNHQLLEIARTRRVGPDVIYNQAHNAGIVVSSI